MIETVSAYMTMVEECLQEARLLFSGKLYRGAAGRAYYAYFDAAWALPASKSITTKSHSAVRNLFGDHFVKEGSFTVKDGRMLHKLFDLRQNSEYDTDEISDVAAVQSAIDVTAEFLLQVEVYLTQNGFTA